MKLTHSGNVHFAFPFFIFWGFSNENVLCSLNFKIVLFQTIQFNISTQFRSIWPRDRNLSGATTLSQSRPESDGNEGVLGFTQRSSIAAASASGCLSHIRILVAGVGSYSSAEKQSVYSQPPADWSTNYIKSFQLMINSFPCPTHFL